MVCLLALLEAFSCIWWSSSVFSVVMEITQLSSRNLSGHIVGYDSYWDVNIRTNHNPLVKIMRCSWKLFKQLILEDWTASCLVTYAATAIFTLFTELCFLVTSSLSHTMKLHVFPVREGWWDKSVPSTSYSVESWNNSLQLSVSPFVIGYTAVYSTTLTSKLFLFPLLTNFFFTLTNTSKVK